MTQPDDEEKIGERPESFDFLQIVMQLSRQGGVLMEIARKDEDGTMVPDFAGVVPFLILNSLFKQ